MRFLGSTTWALWQFKGVSYTAKASKLIEIYFLDMRHLYSNQENIGILFSKQSKINSRRKGSSEAKAAGENCSFTFTVCVKSLPLGNFKPACLVLHKTGKEFFETHLLKWRNKPF